MNSSRKNISIDWDNSLTLPPCTGMEKNVGLAGAFSGFVDDKLIIAGGANFPVGFPWTGGKKTWWSTLYTYDTLKTEWKVYENFLNRPLAYGMTAQSDESLLFIGGCDAERCYSDVTLIKSIGDSLITDREAFPPLPIPLANSAVTVLGNKIYIAGGQESMKEEKSSKHFLVLDLDNRQRGWNKLPEWPGSSRGYAVSMAQKGKIYLFSGRSYAPDEETIMHTDGYEFNPETNEWKKLKGEFPVMAGTAIAYGDSKILFLGGVTEILPTAPEHPGFSNDIVIFDVDTGTIEKLTSSPYPIPVTTKVVAYENNFYITSGEIRPGIRTPHILNGMIKHSQ